MEEEFDKDRRGRNFSFLCYFLKERLKMIDAGTILQKMKKQTFRYVICFAAEGLYLFENDDIGHRFYIELRKH